LSGIGKGDPFFLVCDIAAEDFPKGVEVGKLCLGWLRLLKNLDAIGGIIL